MNFQNTICIIFIFFTIQLQAQSPEPFQHEVSTERKPWTNKDFEQDPMDFQFAIVSDRTGGHREGIFGHALSKLNQLHPEFVMSVGDLIEGYSKDSMEINRQWAEFDSIISQLNIRFFYLPGNHDISNDMMRNQWLTRYGRSYYHFLYKDVLFLALDTNDGDGVVLSDKQVDYVVNTLEQNPDVRWTLLFMHHPIWAYREYNGFEKVEQALADRDYTVLAGHTHRYLQQVRNEHNYYILGTTGGGSRLRGPKFGEYDHVTWVTLTDNGPEMVNLQLSGILDHNVSNMESITQARALMQATQIDPLVLQSANEENYIAYLSLKNTSDAPVQFNGRIFHHHHLDISPNIIDTTLAPRSQVQLTLDITPYSPNIPKNIDPLELDWVMGYKTDKLEPEFQLSGVLPIEIDASYAGLTVTERPIFLDTHTLEITHPYEELIIRYTLDGSDPSETSPIYQEPIEISETTTLTVQLETPSGYVSEMWYKTYEKVSPMAPVKAKKTRSGLSFDYYEGNFLTLPDYTQLTPIRSGVAIAFDPEKIAEERLDHYAIQYQGYIDIPTTGIYTFYVHSDDGSNLYIGEKLVVDNDGSHSARTRKGMIAIEAGRHPFRIDYFEDFLGETLEVSYEGPEVERQPVSFEQFTH